MTHTFVLLSIVRPVSIALHLLMFDFNQRYRMVERPNRSKGRKGDDRQHQVLLAGRVVWGPLLRQAVRVVWCSVAHVRQQPSWSTESLVHVVSLLTDLFFMAAPAA